MAQARQNPIGHSFVNTQLVLVGNSSPTTHIWAWDKEMHLCESGKNAGRKKEDGSQTRSTPTYWKSDAQFVTCIRCMKLGMMNESQGRPAWRGPSDER